MKAGPGVTVPWTPHVVHVFGCPCQLCQPPVKRDVYGQPITKAA